MAGWGFLYFGDNLFDKLKIFGSDFNSHDRDQRILRNVKEHNVAFIDDVFLGWSYILIKCGEIIVYSGFQNDEDKHFISISSKTSKIICCRNKFYIIPDKEEMYKFTTLNLEKTVVKLPSNLALKDLAVGDIFGFVLNEDGSVFHTAFEETLSLVSIPFLPTISEVACGQEHGLFLTSSGQIYSYGNGSRGQLGHGGIENCDSPLVIDALDGIPMKAISCGGWHSAAISYTQDLYVWGWNESGQLGFPCTDLHTEIKSLEEVETVCCLPKLVDFKEDKLITSVKCGIRHTAVLTDDLEVWTWGWNEYCQLGHSENKICDKPTKVPLPNGFIPKYIKSAFWSTLIGGMFNT